LEDEMPDQWAQERTEPASSRKRSKAREKGQVAKSREVNTAFMVGGAFLIFFFCGHQWVVDSLECMRKGLMLPQAWTISSGGGDLLGQWIHQVMKLLLPFVLVLPLIGVVSNIVQVGFLAAPNVLAPQWNRINPIEGAKRSFSVRGLAELVKSIITISAIGVITYMTVRPEIAHISSLADSTLGAALGYLCTVTFWLVLRVWIFMVILAALDYMVQRWQYEKDLRMTKYEVKEELKETEGDPRTRARIRSLQRDLARRRMMEEVPKADVVITNPTHLAVALRYERAGSRAPLVVAKGAEWLAEKIREIARDHEVPVIENRDLAGFLYHHVKVGQEIPVELYQAVAQILAYVYRLKENAGYGIGAS
jgi:flagellar biosynthetic protein FlhB